MNLTEAEKEKLLRSFYAERLLPLANLARERGLEMFPLSGDEGAASYYKERAADGCYVHEINAEEITAELRDLLRTDGLAELAELAEPLISLAVMLQAQEEKEDAGDVSPFIYAMF
jgi:hypothetical protein